MWVNINNCNINYYMKPGFFRDFVRVTIYKNNTKNGHELIVHDNVDEEYYIYGDDLLFRSVYVVQESYKGKITNRYDSHPEN